MRTLPLVALTALAALVLAGCLQSPAGTPTPTAAPTAAPTAVATATPAVSATPASTPTAGPTETPSVQAPSATPLIKDYRCQDGTPQNQCSTVQPGRYCNQYLTYTEDCKTCGCPTGKVCTPFNVCRTPDNTTNSTA